MRAVSRYLFIVLFAAACAAPGQDGESATEGVAVTAAELTAAPDTGCTSASFGGHAYWFCPLLRNWNDARTKCQSILFDLAVVESSAENAFILSKEPVDAWIGGTDTAVEGTWRWPSGNPPNTQFWLGKANGHSVNNAYTNWSSGQPDDLLNQDCLKFRGGIGLGKWTDDSCSLPLVFVCEGDLCQNDPNKTDPGQCGCGNPDTDTDNDGTANCNDGCPSDANKTAPGVCGCGTADADSDGDGTLNCKDECPNDVKKVIAGDCGCSNTPKPSNTACDDGLCAANNKCDGAGACGSPSQCGVPDSNCTFAMRGGSPYWFCTNNRSFPDARQRCQSIPGMDLAVIDGGQGENDFLKSKVSDHTFIGGSDQGHLGNWYWLRTATQFWTGGKNGQSVGGAYTNWEPLQPDDGLSNTKNCLLLDPPIGSGKWETDNCSSLNDYVCELTDLCPLDPLKIDPGVCGCSVADTDTDHDGALDCNDACPKDPNKKTSAGQCGCGVLDTDTDNDSTADCNDPCLTDGNKTNPGVCACGVPDVDTDNDGVPDCNDDCPLDPNNVVRGDCGCLNDPSLQPSGTSCSTGICPGTSVCDGSGRCGDESACRPATGCTPHSREGKIYWFCGGGAQTTTWTNAQQICSTHGGLARIDDADENAFILSLIPGAAWLGGSDTVADGDWRWRAPDGTTSQFWVGAANGAPSGTAYSNWLTNQPGGGTAENCASMLLDDSNTPANEAGRWDDANCSTARFYVCEEFDHRELPMPENAPPLRDCDVYPVLCSSPLPVPATCTPAAGIPTVAGMEAAIQPGGPYGGAPDPASTCPPIEPDPFWCGIENLGPICASVTDCSAGQVCQFVAEGDCFTPGQCLPGEKRCGTPLSYCTGAASQTVGPCDTVDVCPDVQGPAGPSGADVDLTETVGTTPPLPTPPAQTTTYPWPCGGFKDVCNCDLGVGALAPIAEDHGKRKGNSGSGGSWGVTFDPQIFYQTDVNPLPFGDSAFRLQARAQLIVAATLAGRTADIFTAIGSLDVQRCGLTTTADVELLGQDYVDISGTPFPEVNSIADASGVECSAHLANVGLLGDRLKKALRDAEHLLALYNDLKSHGQTFDDDLCSKLMGLIDNGDVTAPDLGQGFPSQPCTTDPVDTINRFITHYNNEAETLRAEMRALATASSGVFGNAGGVHGDLKFLDEDQSFQATVVNATIPIGPIPINIKVQVHLGYGVKGDLRYELDPMIGAFFGQAASDTSKHELGSAQAGVSPHAFALVTAFVGPGIDFGVIAVKIGINANLNLIDISTPLMAKVALDFRMRDDARVVPATLSPLWDGQSPKFPTRNAEYYLDWSTRALMHIEGLSGQVSAGVRVEIPFVGSRHFERILVHYPAAYSADLNLLSAGKSIDIGGVPTPLPAGPDQIPSLGLFQMPVEFVTLAPLQAPGVALTKVPVVADDFRGLYYYQLCNFGPF